MAHASNTRASYGAHVASNTKVVPQHVRNHTRAHDFMLFVIFRSCFFFFFSDPGLWIVVTVLEETIMPIHLFGIPWGKKSISVALWSLVRRKTLAGASYYASMPLKYGKKNKKLKRFCLESKKLADIMWMRVKCENFEYCQMVPCWLYSWKHLQLSNVWTREFGLKGLS